MAEKQRFWKPWPRDEHRRLRTDVPIETITEFGPPGWFKAMIVILLPAFICAIHGRGWTMTMMRFGFGLLVIGVPLWILLGLIFHDMLPVKKHRSLQR